MLKAIKKITEKLNKGENALIMFVGDSITWGENHCTSEQTYCAEFARLLGKRFPNVTVLRYDGIMQGGAMPLKGYSQPVTVQKGTKQTLTVVRCGVGGDTVRRALNRMGDYIGAFITGEEPDAFVAMFGINDALASDPSKFIEPDGFYSDLKIFCELLEEKNKGAEIVDDIAAFDGTHGCTVYGSRDSKTASKFTNLSGDYIKLGWHEGFIPAEQWLRVQKKLGIILYF